MIIDKPVRNNTFSYIRAAAAVAIVFLHTFQYVQIGFGIMGYHKIFLTTSRNLLLWAVPCFVMVSGALLLDGSRELTYKKLFSKYISRILIATFGAIIVYGIVDSILFDQKIGFLTVFKWLGQFFTGNSWTPLWYMYMLLALYLMLPIYKKAAAGMERKDFIYLLVILFLFQSVKPFVETILGIKLGIYICIFTVYTLYFFAGYAVYNGILKINRILAVILIVICLALIGVFSVYAFILGSMELMNIVDNYASCIVVILSVSLFSLMVRRKRSADETDKKVSIFGRLMLSVDKVSLGVYLIHLVVLQVAVYGLKINSYIYAEYFIFIYAIIVLAISYVISHLLHLIPGVRKII